MFRSLFRALCRVLFFHFWGALLFDRLRSVTGVAAESLLSMQQLHAVCHDDSITSMSQLGIEGASWEKIRSIKHLGHREHPDLSLEKALEEAQKAVNPKRLLTVNGSRGLARF